MARVPTHDVDTSLGGEPAGCGVDAEDREGIVLAVRHVEDVPRRVEGDLGRRGLSAAEVGRGNDPAQFEPRPFVCRNAGDNRNAARILIAHIDDVLTATMRQMSRPRPDGQGQRVEKLKGAGRTLAADLIEENEISPRVGDQELFLAQQQRRVRPRVSAAAVLATRYSGRREESEGPLRPAVVAKRKRGHAAAVVVRDETEPTVPVYDQVARRIRAGCRTADQVQPASLLAIANKFAAEFRLGDRPEQSGLSVPREERRIELALRRCYDDFA